ncbi:methylated-DNA--[protein]-cysteine S-methyltransferase [Hymenobacter taeanensis]|uniref:Methylated-DNA--protein-cysteine methyltransferase n=1 Tax=Hymenobacter taeanensis TaxID=2735321 RepID=A0A6M6BKY7_9BACT|nr:MULTISPECIES: methylated-DNA--[protein]-cysteine S-methyltransferase [Hymenobacter]QJX48518.1 methylated-DNA--[protein]-cysteine S-methyltransferase [Hymenobacter taeanensis]UOQ81984.1 methylated-DNA--[protein]-cysteine S-methyltransferase [Hymenobacter sp. 5414T-23]
MESLFFPSSAECYQALVAKDATYEGRFIAAVKTTGIFCRPTCTARKPKPENVEFFATAKQAMLRGYRPCKVCAPLRAPDATPAGIQALLEALAQQPAVKITDEALRQKGMEPATVRRWFQRQHGITFQAYQRLNRINVAFKKLQGGESVTAAAFESGYESLSGFQDSFKAVFGVSPQQSRQQQLIQLTRLETPLGTMLACATEQGVCLLEFTDRRMLETELKDLARRLNAPIIQGDNPYFSVLRAQLAEYFAGTRQEFTVPLFTPGTPFQQAVWQELQAIPYGTTRSYGQQAQALQRPSAVRAVASANGMNRVAILIPCHRVLGADGHLTGYAGGLWRKQWLLDLEAGRRVA